MPTLDEVRERRERIERACADAGRAPIPLSVMTGFVAGRDRAELRDRTRALAERLGSEDLPDTWIVGTLDEATEQLAALRDAGVHRVMLQNLLHTDLDVLALIGDELAPRLA
jgi:alkanesulfonate monooxygenase SsuD/methylene tetrahydromethanopterin reductase-like flavin-dependent oxidoreductase (luciferase family)